jgi:hypothetical protein
LVVAAALAHLATAQSARLIAQSHLAIVLRAVASLAQALSVVASQILNQTHAAKVFHLVLKGSALNALHCVTNQALAVAKDLLVAVRASVHVAGHLADQAEVVHLLDHLADQAVEALVVLVARRGMLTKANTSTPLNLLIRQ